MRPSGGSDPTLFHCRSHSRCQDADRKLVETEGKIVMLGCGLCPNTTLHAIEEYVEPPYLFGQRYRFTITDDQGTTYEQEYRTHGFTQHGYRQCYDKIAKLDPRSFMRSGGVLEAATWILAAPQFKEAVLRKLKEDPFFFVAALANSAGGQVGTRSCGQLG